MCFLPERGNDGAQGKKRSLAPLSETTTFSRLTIEVCQRWRASLARHEVSWDSTWSTCIH